jgi:lipoprotein-anchoring transpeptidase ErfK/SrfK
MDSLGAAGQARRRRLRWAPVTALAAIAGLLAACSSTSSGTPGGPATQTVTQTVAPGSSSASSSTGASSSSSSKPKPKAKTKVHVSLQMSDGTEVGVGMPIIAYLSRSIGDAHAFSKATKVTVNGRQVNGGWYFEYKSGLPGKPIEADYRTADYWPAHARIHMDLPVKGLSAGKNMAFDDSLTLDFTTGPANILTVDNTTHKMSVTSDGKPWGTFPVSLGDPKTPTKRGVKVIMEKVPTVCMHDVHHTYYECGIKFDQRLTYSGEYLHSAPWNVYNITHGVNSSNGCTNLLPKDAEKLYKFLSIGDVVTYRNADGPLMRLGDGYGDWNVPWPEWLGGGLYRTS